jgi:hypothetical protein
LSLEHDLEKDLLLGIESSTRDHFPAAAPRRATKMMVRGPSASSSAPQDRDFRFRIGVERTHGEDRRHRPI